MIFQNRSLMPPALPQIPPPPATRYQCPGERHPVPRSVHLARLQAAYSKCGNCPHRCDQGLAGRSRSEFPPPSRPPSGQDQPLLITSQGIRGRYLNQLTRREFSRISAALAQRLHARRPLRGILADRLSAAATSNPDDPGAAHTSGQFAVVVGYDERPASPDLAIGAVTGLRQSGCRVIDIGRSTGPLWSFAVAHLSADAGLFVTGSGQDASWTGCEFAGTSGHTLPAAELDSIARSGEQSGGRLSRSAGSVSSRSLLADYHQVLQSQFHALRPLHVRAQVASPLVRQLLQQIFAGTPCRLELVATGFTGPSQPPWSPGAWDLGIRIPEDGRSCEVMDEQGRPIPRRQWQRWLAAAVLRDPPENTAPVLIAGEAENHSRLPGALVSTSSSLHDFDQALRQHSAAAGVDADGRFWLGGKVPLCDAILTLARVLRGLSWHPEPVSVQVSQ